MSPIPLSTVVEAIRSQGRWSRHEEWRMSTITTTEIGRSSDPSRHRAYRVRVECDYVFEAHCPTITRAVEIASELEKLLQAMWAANGWASWGSRTVLEPPPDAI